MYNELVTSLNTVGFSNVSNHVLVIINAVPPLSAPRTLSPSNRIEHNLWPPVSTQDELMNIHQILATVLHLGNVCFDAVYSDTDPAEMSSPPAILERGRREGV